MWQGEPGRGAVSAQSGPPPQGKGEPGLVDPSPFLPTGLSCSCSHSVWPAISRPVENADPQTPSRRAGAAGDRLRSDLTLHHDLQPVALRVFRQTNMGCQFLAHDQTVFEIPHQRRMGRQSKRGQVLRSAARESSCGCIITV